MYLRPKTFTQKLPKDCPITHDPVTTSFGGKLFLQVPVPEPKKGQVLVKLWQK